MAEGGPDDTIINDVIAGLRQSFIDEGDKETDFYKKKTFKNFINI